MISYYTSIIIISWLVLGVLSILVWENDRLSDSDKRLMYITYAVISISALSEWLGIKFNGNPSVPIWLLRIVKCADYILTPIAGGTLVIQLRTGSIFKKLIFGVLITNTVFQLICSFTDGMIIINDDHYYSHGKLYIVYILLYMLLILFVITEFAIYGKRFTKQNHKSLIATLILVIIGILMQEIFGGEIRTAYLSLTFGVSMLFIHYVEYSQLAADDKLRKQKILITTDVLTGVNSRYAYVSELKSLNSANEIPQDLAVFSIDINGLKKINDTLGHEAGDELICGAASCIESAVGVLGTCYRTGGDEFIVIAQMSPEAAADTLVRLEEATKSWRGKKVKSLQVAAAYALAADHPDMSVEKLVQVADMAMYSQKNAFYQSTI